MPATLINSTTKGNPELFRSEADLEQRLLKLPAAPINTGTVKMLISRGEGGERREFDSVELQPAVGMPGDSWGRRTNRKAGMELAVMQFDVAMLVANGQSLALFGDNLFVDLDISKANLPPGSRLKMGETVVEVTPDPHDGCVKFKSRFGEGATNFVNKAALRPRNLRGIYFRVLEGGRVSLGDTVQVISRASSPEPALFPK